MSQPTIRVAAALALLIVPATGAIAQPGWVAGQEVAGQTVQVTTNGVTNSISLNADGTASITAPTGEVVPGTWSAANNQLCLSTGGPQECWPYTQAFRAGQQVTLTSNCSQASSWMAMATNEALPPPPPPPEPAPERG